MKAFSLSKYKQKFLNRKKRYTEEELLSVAEAFAKCCFMTAYGLKELNIDFTAKAWFSKNYPQL